MPERGSQVHCGLAEASRDSGLPLQTGRGLRETLIVRQYFVGLGHSEVIYNLSLQDPTAKLEPGCAYL